MVARRDTGEGTKPAPDARYAYVMRPNYAKLVDVALCLLHEAERLDMNVTQFQLVKAAFFADRKHLNDYGRPITFDRYRAMKHGPVGMTFYKMLMGDAEIVRMTGPALWTRRRVEGSEDRYEYFDPERPVDLEHTLSESDVEELHAALAEVKELGVSGTWDKGHEDPAWIAAWKDNEEGRTFAMDYALLYDRPDREAARQLAYYSRHYQ